MRDAILHGGQERRGVNTEDGVAPRCFRPGVVEDRRRRGSLLRPVLDDLRREGRRAALGGAVRGWLAAAGSVLARQDDLVLVKDLSQTPDDGLPQRAGATVEVVTDGNFRRLAEFNERRGASRQTRKFTAWRASGCQCLMMLRDGDVVGHYWWVGREAGARHRHVIRYGIALEDDDAYLFGLFLDPRDRGGGNSASWLRRVEQELRGLGYARIWGMVEAHNAPARWLFATSGYRVVKRISGRAPGSRLFFRGRSVLVAKWRGRVRASAGGGRPSRPRRT